MHVLHLDARSAYANREDFKGNIEPWNLKILVSDVKQILFDQVWAPNKVNFAPNNNAQNEHVFKKGVAGTLARDHLQSYKWAEWTLWRLGKLHRTRVRNKGLKIQGFLQTRGSTSKVDFTVAEDLGFYMWMLILHWAKLWYVNLTFSLLSNFYELGGRW